MATKEQKLFDCLVVVTLREKEGDGAKKLAPTMKYHYPTSITNDSTKSLISSVTEFCFPDLSRFAAGSRKKVKDETFSFVLTEVTGDKRYGYCRRLPSASDGGMPNCWCIISYMPCFKIFSQILEDIITIGVDEGVEACTLFLGNIYNKPLPPPGGKLQVGPTRTFQRPNDSENLLGHVSFEPLLQCLEPRAVLAIFASLLVERRMIFTSESLSTLSATVQAFVAMLYPFLWQHIFIPVLPQSLLSFCCAPMPFVVGILRSALPELEAMQRSGAVEDVVFVDIDNNDVISSFTDIELLPRMLTAPLMHQVETSSKVVKKGGFFGRGQKKVEMSKNDTQDFANAFIGFMVDLLTGYRAHALPAGEKNINLHEFINSKPAELGPLLKMVGETQMFERFIQERLAANSTITPETGKFEKRVSKYTGNRTGKHPSPSRPLPSRPPPSASPMSGTPTSGSPEDNSPSGSLRGRKAPNSRFTMYEMGAISREDITKAVAEEDGPAPKKEDINKQRDEFTISLPDYSSFRKKTSEQEMMHGHFTGAGLGSSAPAPHTNGSKSDLPPPPAPPGTASPSGGGSKGLLSGKGTWGRSGAKKSATLTGPSGGSASTRGPTVSRELPAQPEPKPKQGSGRSGNPGAAAVKAENNFSLTSSSPGICLSPRSSAQTTNKPASAGSGDGEVMKRPTGGRRTGASAGSQTLRPTKKLPPLPPAPGPNISEPMHVTKGGIFHSLATSSPAGATQSSPSLAFEENDVHNKPMSGDITGRNSWRSERSRSMSVIPARSVTTTTRQSADLIESNSSGVDGAPGVRPSDMRKGSMPEQNSHHNNNNSDSDPRRSGNRNKEDSSWHRATSKLSVSNKSSNSGSASPPQPKQSAPSHTPASQSDNTSASVRLPKGMKDMTSKFLTTANGVGSKVDATGQNLLKTSKKWLEEHKQNEAKKQE